MEIKDMSYPFHNVNGDNVWYKFGMLEGAVHLSDKKIEEYVNDCIRSVKRQLENGVESPYAFSASGNAMVICFFNQENQDEIFDDTNYFSVIVAKNYEQADVFIEDIKVEEDNSILAEDWKFTEFIKDLTSEETVIQLNGYEVIIKRTDKK